jgi:hypothetical protein
MNPNYHYSIYSLAKLFKIVNSTKRNTNEFIVENNIKYSIMVKYIPSNPGSYSSFNVNIAVSGEEEDLNNLLSIDLRDKRSDGLFETVETVIPETVFSGNHSYNVELGPVGINSVLAFKYSSSRDDVNNKVNNDSDTAQKTIIDLIDSILAENRMETYSELMAKYNNLWLRSEKNIDLLDEIEEDTKKLSAKLNSRDNGDN